MAFFNHKNTETIFSQGSAPDLGEGVYDSLQKPYSRNVGGDIPSHSPRRLQRRVTPSAVHRLQRIFCYILSLIKQR